MSDTTDVTELDDLEAGESLEDGETRTSDISWQGETKKAKEPPKASWFLLLQFCIYGFVALAPWNFILTDLVYLTSKFQHNFSSTISIYYGLAVNVAQLCIIFYGNKFTFAPRFDVGCSLLAIFNICLAIVAMTVGVDDPCPNTDLGNALGIVCVVLLAFGHAIMESTAFGLAALCPKACMNWVMVGEGIAGVLGWPLLELFDCIFQSVHRKDEWVCLVFFAITSVLTLLAMPMFRHVTSKDPLIKCALEVEDSRKQAGSLKVRQTRRPIWKILKDLAPMAFCAWSVLTITFICFPAQATLWQSKKGTQEATNKFIPLVTFVFQVGDTIGRFAPNLGIAVSEKFLIVIALGRSIFIPLFICTTLYPTVKPFYWNWFKHVEMFIFALTNGLCATLSMMYGPQRVPSDKAEQEVAGYTMGFSLIDGIFIGGLLGTAVVAGLGE